MNLNLIINKNVLNLLKSYINFQEQNIFPGAQNVKFSQQDNVITFGLDTPVTADVLVNNAEVLNASNFKSINGTEDISGPNSVVRTQVLFSCIDEEMLKYYTGSLASKPSKYYLNVYNNPDIDGDEFRQFDISFAHINGSGSTLVEDYYDLRPSRAIYKSIAMTCFETKNKITFKNNKNGDYFYVLSFNRDNMKHRLDPGNIQISLSPLSSSSNQLVNTGSNCVLNQSSSLIYTLIDSSKDFNEYYTGTNNIRDYYHLVSGSLIDGIYDDSESDSWGYVFPKLGIILLDGVVLDQSCSFNTVTSSLINGENAYKLFLSISGSTSPNNVRTETGSFYARSAEHRLSETYFCRVGSNDFNYSSNPTYTDSTGSFIIPSFANQPITFITSIGLYNEKRELLAIGKLPKPMINMFSHEYVFQVRMGLN
jgi:hypothetical protein